MAAMIDSNGLMAGSGACVPSFNGLLALTEAQVQLLVSDVLLVASNRTSRAVQDFYAAGEPLPEVSRHQLASLIAGWAHAVA